MCKQPWTYSKAEVSTCMWTRICSLIPPPTQPQQMNVAAQYSEKIISHIKNSVQKSLAFFQLVSPYWFLFMLEQIVYIFGAILKKKKGKISGLWLGNCNHDSFLFSAILLQISLCITAEHLHFGLIFLNAVVPEVLWFVQLQPFKPKLRCHVLFKQKKLSPGNPVKQATLAQLFSNCTVMKVNMLSEAWSLTCSCLFSGGFLWGLDGLTLWWICWGLESSLQNDGLL